MADPSRRGTNRLVSVHYGEQSVAASNEVDRWPWPFCPNTQIFIY